MAKGLNVTNEFKALMRLVGAAAQGKAVSDLPNDLDWLKMECLANEQAVQTLLGYALRLSPKLLCPEEQHQRLVGQMRQLAFSNNAWKNSILQLIGKMNETGIPALLIKGYAVADCYAAPDCRMSGDTDLLIRPKDEKCACTFMKANGFEVERRWKNGHHDVCNHPQLGCVELHVRLYDEIVEDVWFGRMDGREFVCETPIEVTTQGGSYCTLGYTDHMIFLMLHLIKHFILSGLSLRMMLDVVLFFSHHAEKIDSVRFWKTMEGLKYTTIAQSILWATVRYCGIDASDIPGLCDECPKKMERILDDLENGGWLGKMEEKARQEGWYEYNRQLLMKNRNKTQYWLFMLRWKKDMYLKAIFPSSKILTAQYPCIQKHPFLIPFVLLHRLVFRGSRAVKKGTLTNYIIADETKIGVSAQARVQMFKDLGMMD